MKISRLCISSFGKLMDFDLRFEDGLNCIERDNEFGKSTMLAFIRAMFYGFPPRVTPGVKEYGRKKYLPWGAKSFGGSVEFSHEDRQYVLERTFFSRKSEDHLALNDAQTGAQIDIGDTEIGEFLFGIGEAEFVNTVFVGQMSSGFSSTGKSMDSVADRLANLAATGNEDYSFDAAQKNLKEAATALIAVRGNGGKIREMEQRRSDLVQKEHYAIDLISQMEEMAVKIQEYDRKIEEIQQNQLLPARKAREAIRKQIEETEIQKKKLETQQIEKTERKKALTEAADRQAEFEKIRLAEKRRRAENMQQLDNEIHQAEADLLGCSVQMKQIKDEYIARGRFLQKELDTIEKDIQAEKESYSEKEAAFRALRAEVEERNRRPDEVEEAGNPVKQRRKITLGIILAVITFAIAFLSPLLAYLLQKPIILWAMVLLLPASVLLVIIRIQTSKMKREVRDTHSERIQRMAQIDESREAMAEGSRRLQENQMILQKKKFEMESVQREYQSNMQNCNENETRLNVLLESLKGKLLKYTAEEPSDVGAGVDVSANTITNTAMLKLSSDINELSAMTSQLARRLDELSVSEGEQLAREDAAQKELAKYREESARLQGGREELELRIPNRLEIEEQQVLIEERIAQAGEYYKALKVAADAMQKASSEMERIFAPQVNQSAGQYLEKLTEGQYSSLRFDRDFRVELATEKDLAFRDSDYFSAGTADQVYLALRLAIADLIQSGDDRMPLLLDDALVQYDEQRVISAIRLLRELSEDRQVIMFTCHRRITERISTLWKESGV